MSRRERYVRCHCSFDGCSEWGDIPYTLQREYPEAVERAARWRCTRHRRDGRDVLGTENRSLGAVAEVVETEHGKYWRIGDEPSLNGIIRGPGFQGFARDFPVGTLVSVAAVLQLPTSPPL